MRQYILIIPMTCWMGACSQSSFTGDQGKKAVTPEQTEGDSNGVDGADCTKTSKTFVSSDADSITNNAPEQFVSYKIGLDGCKILLKDASIWADINATVKNNSRPLPYKIKTLDGELLASGQLGSVQGEDLFGNSGENYAHWKTDDIDLDLRSGSVIFELDYSYMSIKKTLGNLPNNDFQVETYFSISGAEAVTLPLTIIVSP